MRLQLECTNTLVRVMHGFAGLQGSDPRGHGNWSAIEDDWRYATTSSVSMNLTLSHIINIQNKF